MLPFRSRALLWCPRQFHVLTDLPTQGAQAKNTRMVEMVEGVRAGMDSKAIVDGNIAFARKQGLLALGAALGIIVLLQ